MTWIVDRSQNGISSVTVGGSTRTVEITATVRASRCADRRRFVIRLLVDIEDVRARLMLSLVGIFGVGCGPSVEPSDDDAGEGMSIGPGTGGASSGASATSTAGADADSSSEHPKDDIGGNPPPDCPPQPRPPAEECAAELPPGKQLQFYCVELSEGETCEAWVRGYEWDPELEDEVAACTGYVGEWCEMLRLDGIGCGPLPDFGDQCCVWFIVEPWWCPPEGRPFVVNGRQRLATLVERDDWVGIADVVRPPVHHAAIAAMWAEQALAEHASIASFARFTLQLLACGAPASLVSAAHAALGEEIEHARLFFTLASHFAGRTLGPSALDVHEALTGFDDLDEVVLATVREGCIAETLSAWRITLAARSARDPALAAALARVAEQELGHAALAWRFLAWALPRASASLRRRVEATLDEPARHAPAGPLLAAEVPAAEWLAHGILPPSEHAAATQQALRELVAPLARAVLLAQPTLEVQVAGASSNEDLRAR
jgi:hypothetical protein